MKKIVAVLAFAALAACGPANPPMQAASEKAAPAPEAFVAGEPARDMADGDAVGAGAPEKPTQPGTPAGGVLLAYAYAMALETPAAQVAPVMKKHEAACVAAGPAVCQVLGSSTNSYGEEDKRAALQLRGEPRWLAGFRAGLEGDAKAAGGRLISSAVTSEDLTRAIVDTEAQLRAQRTLRDRLQGLLASRPGKLSDLLDVERELAQTQGRLDSLQSNLAVMRARVDMSTLTIDYASAGAPVTDRTFEPIREAAVDFFRLTAEGVATMIKLLAVALPWLLLAWGAAALFRWRARKRRAAKPSSVDTPAA